MASYVIRGGHALAGRLTVHGAKNSILPILAAALLNRTGEPIRLVQVPALQDVRSMLEILAGLGVEIDTDGGDVILHTAAVDCHHVPEGLMREMRSSIFLMGPLLGRLGRVRVCYPGGCAIGERPINLHLKGLQAMGAVIEEQGDFITARGRLAGAEIRLAYPSVGATENLILAAVLARGETTIYNAAREPEIVDLQNFLNKMGGKVSGAGGATIKIAGSGELHGGSYRVFPDRIAGGTYLLAAAITRGSVTLEKIIPGHFGALVKVLRQAGVEVEVGEDSIAVGGGVLKAVPRVDINPYPGFPTDLQPPLLACLSVARGTSTVIEHVFKDRFHHVYELRKMGARINLQGHKAVIEGVAGLKGAAVEATDLRAGAALVLAGLAAAGETVVSGIKHIDRGYEDLSRVLGRLGARIERTAAPVPG